ncbi:hypothetical protein [Flavobacterium alkalisoli]|uniref:hypothetical protein n=1 Tax=Flavobacterium alkalisoli TaxID=2602769 RepID=UPI003A90AAB4
MPLSDSNLNSLMLEIHNSINSYSNELSENVTYPPGGELTEAEKEELKKISNNPVLKSALQKITADTAAAVVFDIFCLIDGVTDPADEWTGIKLEDIAEDEEPEPEEMMLHDKFYDTYPDRDEHKI